LSTAEAPAHCPSPLPEADSTGRAALRKASLRLLPLIGIGYLIAYMDRVNVSFAALQMNQALHFSAAAYGLGAGLFFVTYAVCEVPSNLLLVHFGARRWLARIMFSWGLVSVAMVFVRTSWQFYLVRLALGAAEAGFFPGVIFYLSLWFPVAKRSQAISRFYIALPLSSVVMGSLAGLLLNLNGHLHLAGWQWLFLIEGLPAIILSVIFLLCLPDGPQQAAWLTTSERNWILHQLQIEAAHSAATHNTGDIIRAFREPRVWLLGVFLFCLYLGLYGYTFTAPAVVQQVTGFGATEVGLIIALFGILGALAMLLNGWHSDRSHERYLHALVPALMMAVAFVAVGLSDRPAIVLPTFALIFIAVCAFQPPAWALPTTFLSGKSAAVAVSTINMIAICGGFLGPWWMGEDHGVSGTYQRGLLTLAIPALLASAIILVARRYSKAEAAQRQMSISNT
jgi:MFS transporter, ACS family, tartrate transporter